MPRTATGKILHRVLRERYGKQGDAGCSAWCSASGTQTNRVGACNGNGKEGQRGGLGWTGGRGSRTDEAHEGRRRNACWEARSDAMRRNLPFRSCARDHHDVAQRLSYLSWWRHQMPVSLRPLGAWSSHWYMPQRPSSPRA